MVSDEYVVFVCIHVIEMLIMSNDMKGVTKTKRFLSSTFKMKDHGQVDTILGSKLKIKKKNKKTIVGVNNILEKLSKT